jgi:hypothetical protein
MYHIPLYPQMATQKPSTPRLVFWINPRRLDVPTTGEKWTTPELVADSDSREDGGELLRASYNRKITVWRQMHSRPSPASPKDEKQHKVAQSNF